MARIRLAMTGGRQRAVLRSALSAADAPLIATARLPGGRTLIALLDPDADERHSPLQRALNDPAAPPYHREGEHRS